VESMFLLSKSQHYYSDMEAIRVEASESYKNDGRWETGPTDRNIKFGYEAARTRNPKATHKVFNGEKRTTRNRRNSDWFFESWQGLYEEDGEPLAFIVNTNGFSGAHFATFPPKLIEPCIKAGSRVGDCVLDPFAGSGTTGMVSNGLSRQAILIELNPAYVKLIEQRCGVSEEFLNL
jgi:DNA modification methylase